MTLFRGILVAGGGFVAAALNSAPAIAQTIPGFVVIEFKVKDAESFRTYGQRAPATVTQYGGKFLVRGAKPENLKGDMPQGPFLVLAFESADQARKWETRLSIRRSFRFATRGLTPAPLSSKD